MPSRQNQVPPPLQLLRFALRGSVLSLLISCSGGSTAYVSFRPEPEQMARLHSDEFTFCIDEASYLARSGSPALQDCYTAEFARVEALLATTLLSRRTVPADEVRWRATYKDGCDRDNPHHGGWGWLFEMQQCYLDELRRRVLWLETRP